MVKDKQPPQDLDGTTIDLLQDTSSGDNTFCHVTGPEVHRNRTDGKNQAPIGLPGSNVYTGKGSSYRRSIDAQIRKTMANSDLANSSLGSTMTYCHKCYKSQQIYDQRNITSPNNNSNNNFSTPVDSKVPLSFKNFTTCSIPCLFDTFQDNFQTMERSANLPIKNSTSHHRSPQSTMKRTTNNGLDLPRRCFKLPTNGNQDAIMKLNNPRQEGLYKIHFSPPPVPPLLSINKRGAKKQQKSWKRAMFSCSAGEDSADSLAGSYKPGSTPLETSEDDLLTVSGEGHKKDGRRISKTTERYIGCIRVRTCSKLVVVVLLMLLILVTVVGLLPSLVFWVLSTQQDKYPATMEGHMTASGEELNVDVTHVTSSPPITRRGPELLFIDSEGWTIHKHSKYKTIDKPMSFYNAQEFCQKLGGHLVHINSLREQVFIEDYIIQLLHIQNLTTWEDGIGFWIGARRDRGSHEGTCMFDQWKWVDPYGRTLGVVAGFAAFIPGKPDNYYRPEECLFLSYKDRMDEAKFLKWDDAPCDLNSVGGIRALCEVETR